ncbi:MAG: alcohol dehydrogenase catalytic domain-containing protein [Nitrospirae bacterium]|nr:alcohol dehydrogenase catalytic domain-containing protein [Nitrospirota bacterium]
MKALVFNNGLQYRTDYPMPELKENEALIRVIYAGICNTDIEITKGYMGFQGVPGHEFVGVVEKCGESNLVGKRVSGEINVGCGACSYCREDMQNHCPDRSVPGILNKDGAFAEYITLPVRNLHIIPDSLSDEEAVFIEPLAAAFEILKQVKITPSDKVCVLGDGKLGLLVGQALSTTSCDLVVVGKHKEKLSILEGMGIRTELISSKNPPTSPFSKGGLNSPLSRGVRGVFPSLNKSFDIVVDCTGSPSGIETALALVKPRGKIILKTTVAGSRQIDLNKIVIDEISVLGSRCGPFPAAIKAIEAKKVNLLPLVGKRFNLKNGVKAFEYASRKGALKALLKIN